MNSIEDNKKRQAAHLNAERLIRLGTEREVVVKSLVERGISEVDAKKKVEAKTRHPDLLQCPTTRVYYFLQKLLAFTAW